MFFGEAVQFLFDGFLEGVILQGGGADASRQFRGLFEEGGQQGGEGLACRRLQGLLGEERQGQLFGQGHASGREGAVVLAGAEGRLEQQGKCAEPYCQSDG